MVLRRLIPALFLTCLLATAGSAALAGQTPTERVREGADKLIEMLSDPDMQDAAKHDAAIDRLRAVADEYIDFGLVTKYAVGRPWLEMSDDLRTKLTEAFVNLLERSYLKQIPTYGGQNVDYKSELVQGDRAKVVTEIIDNDKKIVVEFRLKIVQEKWMIYDIVAEGVSLVMNYRSQFAEILNQGTGEDLLKVIEDRIRKIDEGQEPEGNSES
ncbi:MAG: ABC transporter substrate-binding protein [Pseudodesulfovibrio sp.]|jgi:phospholipid transport system substrate-binding protein|uniref:Phospholipid transport system substrate-binding protein n=1 Tax=Pseudodesulfovibrio indicus TaxID=1716143 RepID=A0A126QLB7_9BACT|nr:ABC transporter substrate-binding protein [Pseudodesulfovibrio indicus]AMK10468.1 toluene tolerance protein [Pseudodesulfovibrio indicus]TDT89135.1 phospholipid transport system substrate-binding protein [Pseudodesulfovibrio indicus]